MGNQFVGQRTGGSTVVGTEIANVEIKGDPAQLRPGMYGEVRFGKNDRAGNARSMVVVIPELMEKTANDGQAVTVAGIAAPVFQFPAVEQAICGAAAVMQVGDKVEAVHRIIY